MRHQKLTSHIREISREILTTGDDTRRIILKSALDAKKERKERIEEKVWALTGHRGDPPTLHPRYKDPAEHRAFYTNVPDYQQPCGEKEIDVLRKKVRDEYLDRLWRKKQGIPEGPLDVFTTMKSEDIAEERNLPVPSMEERHEVLNQMFCIIREQKKNDMNERMQKSEELFERMGYDDDICGDEIADAALDDFDWNLNIYKTESGVILDLTKKNAISAEPYPDRETRICLGVTDRHQGTPA